MPITRKITATLITAGVALFGTQVASAQSSSLFTNLSSSSPVVTQPESTDYEQLREEYRDFHIDKLERDGHNVTDEANAIAQQAAEELAAGVPDQEVSIESGPNAGILPRIIPNAVLESNLATAIQFDQSLHYNIRETAGVGVAGNDVTTYVVLYDSRES